jgi:hypothetical protein
MSATTLPSTMKLVASGLPVNQYIECTRCLENSTDDSDVTGWAEGHITKRPGHDIFRTVSSSSWRLVPRENTRG